MIYKILCDGNLIYDSRDEEKLIVNPTLELEVNKAGSLAFIILPGSEYIVLIKKRLTLKVSLFITKLIHNLVI